MMDSEKEYSWDSVVIVTMVYRTNRLLGTQALHVKEQARSVL